MPRDLKIFPNERRPIYVEYYDKDGDAKDITNYTITPYLYYPDSFTVYKSGADAGTITKTDATSGQFTYAPASDIFESGKLYDLYFRFVYGTEDFYMKASLLIHVRS